MVIPFHPHAGRGTAIEVQGGVDLEGRELAGFGEDGGETGEGRGGRIADGPLVASVGQDEGAAGILC